MRHIHGRCLVLPLPKCTLCMFARVYVLAILIVSCGSGSFTFSPGGRYDSSLLLENGWVFARGTRFTLHGLLLTRADACGSISPGDVAVTVSPTPGFTTVAVALERVDVDVRDLNNGIYHE